MKYTSLNACFIDLIQLLFFGIKKAAYSKRLHNKFKLKLFTEKSAEHSA